MSINVLVVNVITLLVYIYNIVYIDLIIVIVTQVQGGRIYVLSRNKRWYRAVKNVTTP